jgi:arsenate reductase (thioredoxin)
MTDRDRNPEEIENADRPEVLFLCTHNAGRSQMAAAFLRRIGRDRVVVRSAGSEPAEALNPAVVAALAEVGLAISGEHPKLLVAEMAETADVIVTMGCGDVCPVYPGKRYLDWELADPDGKPIEEVRPIRDEIERRVLALVAELVARERSPDQETRRETVTQ